MDRFKNKPLNIVFISMIVLFLLFCGGALSVTISDNGLMRSGTTIGMMNGAANVTMGSFWTGGISWMWVPAMLFFTLSILLGWVIFGKKKV